MSAFTLAKLKQNKSAAAAYAEAETFYENRANVFSNTLNQLTTNTNDWQSVAQLFSQHGIKESPEALASTDQLRVLGKLLNYPISDKTKSIISNAYSKILASYQLNTKNDIDKKLGTLNSYLNQSRFGLTKLYDTP
jgi:hypothetical protein